MYKRMRNWKTITLGVFAVVLLAAGAPAVWAQDECTVTSISSAWYRSHATSEQDLIQQKGTPAHSRMIADGKEVFYKANDGWGNKGFRVYRIQDGQVVGSNWAGSPELQKPVKQTEPVELAGSREYYAKFPMSENELRRKWGAPVKNCDLENGQKRLFFQTQDGWENQIKRFFIVEDGNVVASGICCE